MYHIDIEVPFVFHIDIEVSFVYHIESGVALVKLVDGEVAYVNHSDSEVPFYIILRVRLLLCNTFARRLLLFSILRLSLFCVSY